MIAAGLVYARFCHIFLKYGKDVAVIIRIPWILCCLGIHLVIGVRILQILESQIYHIAFCKCRLAGGSTGLPVIIPQHIRGYVRRFPSIHNGGSHSEQVAADRVSAVIAGEMVKRIQVRVCRRLASGCLYTCQDAALQFLIEIIAIRAVPVNGAGNQGIALISRVPVTDMGIRTEGPADICRLAAEHTLIRFGFGIRKQITDIACFSISEAVPAERCANKTCGIIVSARRGNDITGEPADLDLSPFIAADNTANRIGSGTAHLAALYIGVNDIGILDRPGHAADICRIPINVVSGSGIGVHGSIQDRRIGGVAYNAADRGISVTEAVRRRNIRPHSHFVRDTVFDYASTVRIRCI